MMRSALLDLLDVEQVARVRVAVGPGRDVELELRVDAVRVRATDVVGHAGRAQRRADMHIRRAVSRSIAPRPFVRLTKISFSLMSCACSSMCLPGVAHPVAEAAQEVVVEVTVDAADAQVVEEQLLARQRRQHLDDLVALGEAPEDGRQAARGRGRASP